MEGTRKAEPRTMAQPTMTSKGIAGAVGGTLAAVAIVAALRSPLALVDRQVMAAEYALRGNRPVDSSLVIVYVDDRAIGTLGWPVRRNFYALMVRALTELRVRAVGIEVMFEDPRPEFSEYDDLLAGIARASKNVVLPAYAGMLGTTVDSTAEPVASFPGVHRPAVEGTRVHLPFPELRAAAAGIGHLNFVRESDVPVFIGDGSGVLPSFALEVLRVGAGVGREGIRADTKQVSLNAGALTLGFRTESDGSVGLNFPGRFSSFPAY